MHAHTIDTLDDQMTTHQHIDVPIANASDIGTAEGLPSETGIAASGTEPIDAPMQTTQQHGDIGPDVIGDDTRYSATEEDIAPLAPAIWPQAMPRNLGVAVAMALLAIIGIVAGQVIGSINNRTKTTFSDIAHRLDSSTPPTTEHNATKASQIESTSVALHQDLISAGATLLKEIQQMRERWVDRTDKTIGTLKVHREMFSIVLTGAQSDLIQEYINKFERLHADGMAQFAAMENGLLEPTSLRIRSQRLMQLDQEWKETGKEFGRRGREVGLK